MTNRVEIHAGSDTVVHLRFRPRVRSVKRHWWKPARLEVDGYDDQTRALVPEEICEPYGLEEKWGFRLQSPDTLWVFVQLKPAPQISGMNLSLSVGGLFPHLTLSVPLEIQGGMAIAAITIPEPIDLMERKGEVTLFVEET